MPVVDVTDGEEIPCPHGGFHDVDACAVMIPGDADHDGVTIDVRCVKCGRFASGKLYWKALTWEGPR